MECSSRKSPKIGRKSPEIGRKSPEICRKSSQKHPDRLQPSQGCTEEGVLDKSSIHEVHVQVTQVWDGQESEVCGGGNSC